MVQRYTSEPRDFPGELADAYAKRIAAQRQYELLRTVGALEPVLFKAYEAMQEADATYNQLLQASRDADAVSNHRTGRVVLWLMGMATVALVVVCCAGWFSPF